MHPDDIPTFYKKPHNQSIWRTQDELEYIDALPLDKLRIYLSALRKREVWDGMDRERVIRRAEYRLRGRAT